MIIYIPTRGRIDRQKTLSRLTPRLQSKTILVVNDGQGAAHKRRWGTVVRDVWEVPPKYQGIAYVRHFIMENSPDPFVCMLDDDLSFNTKNKDWEIIPSTDKQIDFMFNQMETWLLEDGLAHVSLTPRFLNWQFHQPFREVTRMMHVLAYNTQIVKKAGASFVKGVGHTFSMDDFHMTLQLLEAGLKNRVDLINCTSQRVSNAYGGASEWRTTLSHNATAELLAQLHPKVVKVTTKTDWRKMGGGERKDVIIQWQKAFTGGEYVGVKEKSPSSSSFSSDKRSA
jgi:hypothetical protein